MSVYRIFQIEFKSYWLTKEYFDQLNGEQITFEILCNKPISEKYQKMKMVNHFNKNLNVKFIIEGYRKSDLFVLIKTKDKIIAEFKIETKIQDAGIQRKELTISDQSSNDGTFIIEFLKPIKKIQQQKKYKNSKQNNMQRKIDPKDSINQQNSSGLQSSSYKNAEEIFKEKASRVIPMNIIEEFINSTNYEKSKISIEVSPSKYNLNLSDFDKSTKLKKFKSKKLNADMIFGLGHKSRSFDVGDIPEEEEKHEGEHEHGANTLKKNVSSITIKPYEERVNRSPGQSFSSSPKFPELSRNPSEMSSIALPTLEKKYRKDIQEEDLNSTKQFGNQKAKFGKVNGKALIDFEQLKKDTSTSSLIKFKKPERFLNIFNKAEIKLNKYQNISKTIKTKFDIQQKVANFDPYSERIISI